MVHNLSELSLHLRPPAVKSAFPDYLADFPITGVGDSGDLLKLKEFIHGLEEEVKKIQAFPRELPLSSALLNDVIGKLKEKVNKREERRPEPAPEPEERKFGGSLGVKLGKNDVVEKKDWMSAVQLWGQRNEEKGWGQREEGRVVSAVKEMDKGPRLSLMIAPAVMQPVNRVVQTGSISPGSGDRVNPRPMCHAASRKQRRCWSPELHRRFVDALEKLGGPQVATPKQIRDQMGVTGLTNDEVKSHLQKYRLHVRKLPGGGTKTPSAVDERMGGDILELGYSNSDIQQQSRSPEGPLHMAGSKKGNSSNMEEDEEENSDGQS